MGTKSAAGLLTSVDSMFTTQEERDNAQRSYLTDLPTAEISDFPDHPFRVRMDESMTELTDSVRERGVLHGYTGTVSDIVQKNLICAQGETSHSGVACLPL